MAALTTDSLNRHSESSLQLDAILATLPVNTAVETSSDISSDSDSGSPVLKHITQEEALAARALKRAQKSAEIHAKAEVFKKLGDELFEKEKYEEAYIPYLEATQVWTTNVSYYVALATTYVKLEWFEEAAHSATRALTLNPKSLDARYLRGVARLEQKLLRAAKTDFETVLQYDAGHAEAQASLTALNELLGAHRGTHQPSLDPVDNLAQGLDFSYPHHDDEALEMASMSHSSDCNHTGNGVGCRFYNHEGCAKGFTCPYAHAPDEKSVRDDLGRNVCIYFLLDSCRYGEARCVYSHSKDLLPKRGWWRSAEQTAKIKAVLELTEKTAKLQRAIEQNHRKLHPKPTSTRHKPKTPRPKVAETDGQLSNKENQGEPKAKTSTQKLKHRPRSKLHPKTSVPSPIVQETDRSITSETTEKADSPEFTDYKPNTEQRDVEVAPDVILSY